MTPNEKISDESVKQLTNLKKLSLGETKNITDNSVSLLTNLTDLSLGTAEKVTLLSLCLLKNIRNVTVTDGDDVTKVFSIPNFKKLTVYSTFPLTLNTISLLFDKLNNNELKYDKDKYIEMIDIEKQYEKIVL